jgi:DNA-binding GntR family transcriptional regulator
MSPSNTRRPFRTDTESQPDAARLCVQYKRPMGTREETRAGRGTQTLREAILTLRLVPGTRLVEREMVGQPGVSRTGVRAALQSLEAEGLVARGRRGVFSVAVVSRDEARQIHEVRAALEPAARRGRTFQRPCISALPSRRRIARPAIKYVMT